MRRLRPMYSLKIVTLLTFLFLDIRALRYELVMLVQGKVAGTRYELVSNYFSRVSSHVNAACIDETKIKELAAAGKREREKMREVRGGDKDRRKKERLGEYMHTYLTLLKNREKAA